MKTYSLIFAGASTIQLNVVGRYFRLLSVPSAVDVKLFKGGSLLSYGDISGVLAGLSVTVPGGEYFDRVEITSAGAQTVQLGIGDGTATYDRSDGNVTVTNATVNGAHVPTAETVTNASTTIIAANAARKYLLIQNQDATGNIWVRCDGAAAAATSACFKIPPGGSWEFLVAPTGAVTAIGDIASNANVHAIEA